MNLGKNLADARKKSGLSQEAVAEKLGVSRQTISKWEVDETVPDIYQSKKLALLYNRTLDQLIEFDVDIQEIEEFIDKTSDEVNEKVDWTAMWAKKYPVLATYPQTVEVEKYAEGLRALLTDLKKNYGYNDLDALLVLKDILGKEMTDSEKN